MAMDVSEALCCLGCAMLAGIATGAYASTREAVARTVKVNHTYQPDPAAHARYAEKFTIYADLSDVGAVESSAVGWPIAWPLSVGRSCAAWSVVAIGPRPAWPEAAPGGCY